MMARIGIYLLHIFGAVAIERPGRLRYNGTHEYCTC